MTSIPSTPTPPTIPAGPRAAIVRPVRRVRALAALTAVTVAIALWWAATTLFSASQSLLSQTAPQRVLPALFELVERGVLFSDIGISLWRLLIGLLVAIVIGVPAGLLVGSSRLAESATGPLIAFLRMISPLSWTPIALALFGIGNQPVIFLIAVAAVWPVLLNTAAGVRAVDPGLLQVARSFHANRVELLAAVVLPAARAHIQTGIRTALGIAWVVLVPAEMLGVRSGLGYQILNARDQLAYDQVVAVILVIGAIGYVLDTVARVLVSARRPV